MFRQPTRLRHRLQRVESPRAGTRIDSPDSYECFRLFCVAAEEPAFRRFIPNFVSREVVI